MSCCGQHGGRGTISQADIDRGLKARVEYGGGRTVTVSGTVTGRSYVFSGLQRVQLVDPRDAAALVKDRRFALKGLVRPSPATDGGR